MRRIRRGYRLPRAQRELHLLDLGLGLRQEPRLVCQQALDTLRLLRAEPLALGRGAALLLGVARERRAQDAELVLEAPQLLGGGRRGRVRSR